MAGFREESVNRESSVGRINTNGVVETPTSRRKVKSRTIPQK